MCLRILGGEKMSKRVLWYGDFLCTSGFSQVNQNIVEQLKDKFEFTIIAINHFGEPYDFKRWPFLIFPAIDFGKAAFGGDKFKAYKDVFGRQRLIDFLSTGQFDILFTLQDPFIVSLEVAEAILKVRAELKKKGKDFKWIFYTPVDGSVKKEWIDGLDKADFPITYTNWALEEIKKISPETKTRVIYHGVNLKDFYPIPKDKIDQFRTKYFTGKADGKFLITNVNRNQPRKDLPHTLMVFKKFKQKHPDALLYLHCRMDDVGNNLLSVANDLGLKPLEDYLFPAQYDEHDGFPVEVMNLIYNASDCVLTTTLGEGWGLSVTEAMATKTPVVAPNNTSLTEICADGRCKLTECGQNMVTLQADFDRLRPVVDVDDVVKQLESVYLSWKMGVPSSSVEKAYQWVKTLSWDLTGKKWLEVFEKASYIAPKQGRNDLCACGSKKKYKKCHGREE